ncbi:hypothetical protein Taro_038969 [Colocasia esculenta]|uniref:Probable magnesium transporter n=1 Tax=Colocasia esculenta TaxID=4460 RepID=A0A843W9G3_COLES|nr:hypothetical protein [Colocasia esculenta]
MPPEILPLTATPLPCASACVSPVSLSLSLSLSCAQLRAPINVVVVHPFLPRPPSPSATPLRREELDGVGCTAKQPEVQVGNGANHMVSENDNIRGLSLAVLSSAFIGSSFIIKKKGLKRAGLHGLRAGSGGHSYLYEPMWWLGMSTSEVANFFAYAFAPAILVTPLGALSIIFSAVLAHVFLDEKLHILGVLGCVLCVVGSIVIALHAPVEKDIESVEEVWHLATEPGFLVYAAAVFISVLILIIRFVPRYGHTHMIVYIGLCSLMGSITVMAVKALAIGLKLTFSGLNQFVYAQTWFFAAVVAICCVLQIHYLNKALDTFNTAVVSPVYYVMFTSFTIFASMIMFKDWSSQSASQITTEVCGFVTILSGTFLLHKTKDMVTNLSSRNLTTETERGIHETSEKAFGYGTAGIFLEDCEEKTSNPLNLRGMEYFPR